MPIAPDNPYEFVDAIFKGKLPKKAGASEADTMESLAKAMQHQFNDSGLPAVIWSLEHLRTGQLKISLDLAKAWRDNRPRRLLTLRHIINRNLGALEIGGKSLPQVEKLEIRS